MCQSNDGYETALQKQLNTKCVLMLSLKHRKDEVTRSQNSKHMSPASRSRSSSSAPSEKGLQRSAMYCASKSLSVTYTTTPQPFYGPFSGTTRVSRCQKRTSGLYGARED